MYMLSFLLTCFIESLDNNCAESYKSMLVYMFVTFCSVFSDSLIGVVDT
jgi:hypothetical protein